MAFKIATEKKGSKTQEIETPAAVGQKISEYVALKEHCSRARLGYSS